MSGFDQLVHFVTTVNPLHGFFFGLSVLFFCLMFYVFSTASPSDHGPWRLRCRTGGDHHCHIKRHVLKWRFRKS